MVFGTFDCIHEGHRAFFKEAKSQGDYLIVVVAQDHIVEQLKGHLPKINLTGRFEALKKEAGVNEVVISDAKIGTWEVVKKYRPEVITLGYDQEALKKNLEAYLKKFDPFDKLRAGWHPEIKVMHAYEPDKFHSSILS